MAPFEPKIDSKEFEVAIPDQTAMAASGSTASQAADITIRVWRQDTSGSAAALNWNAESVLVYMIADLVSASRGRTAPESPAGMVAHFDSSLAALVAAKRIQTAILEFLACRPGDYVGAAVLIHPPTTAGFSAGMAQSALRLTEPGQIILSEELSRRLQDLPGIELRAVPALTTGGAEHAGLSELIWTSAERLESLRNAARAAAPIANAGPPVGATMMVNAPVAGTGRIEMGERKPPAPATDTLKQNREGAFEEGLADFEERRSFITRSRLIIGVVAIVLVGAAIALFYPSGGSKVKPKPQESQTVDTPATQPSQPESAPPQPPPVVQALPQVKPPVVKQPVVKPQPDKTAKDKDKGKNPPEEVPIQGFEGNSTYDGMTQRDIPRLLQWARSDAGNGRYEKAGQEYRVILALQPGNPDAKEGLRKLQLAQGRDQ